MNITDYISIFIHHTDLTLTNYVKKKLEPYNLAPEQNLVMMLLWEKDGRSPNEIAELLLKDKTNIARMISSLEKKGFIQRVISEKDRRSFQLFLTPTGKIIGEEVRELAEEFNKVVCRDITEEELTELRRVLTKMRGNVQ